MGEVKKIVAQGEVKFSSQMHNKCGCYCSETC